MALKFTDLLPEDCHRPPALLQEAGRAGHGSSHRRTPLRNARWRGEFDRGRSEAHGREHAVPMDRLPDERWREAGPQSRLRIHGSAPPPARRCSRCGRTVGRGVFAALEPLSDADLGRTITIRGEAHSVMQAINRQSAHYPDHIGQIVPAGEALRRDRGNR